MSALVEEMRFIGGPSANMPAAKFFAAVARKLDAQIYEAMLSENPESAEAPVMYLGSLAVQEGSSLNDVHSSSIYKTIKIDDRGWTVCTAMALASMCANMPALDALLARARPEKWWVSELQQCALLALAHEFDEGFEKLLDKLAQLSAVPSPVKAQWPAPAVNGMPELIKAKESRVLDLAASPSFSESQRMEYLKRAAEMGIRDLPEKMASRGVWLTRESRRGLSFDASAKGFNAQGLALLAPNLPAAARAGRMAEEISSFGISGAELAGMLEQGAAEFAENPRVSLARDPGFADFALESLLGQDAQVSGAAFSAAKGMGKQARLALAQAWARRIAEGGRWAGLGRALQACSVSGAEIPFEAWEPAQLGQEAIEALAGCKADLAALAQSAAEKGRLGQVKALLEFDLELGSAQISRILELGDAQVAVLGAKHVKDASKLGAKALAKLALFDPEGSRELLEKAGWSPLTFLKRRGFCKALEQSEKGEAEGRRQNAAEPRPAGPEDAPGAKALRKAGAGACPLESEVCALERQAQAWPGPIGEKLLSIAGKTRDLGKAPEGADWAFASHLLRERIPRLLQAYAAVGQGAQEVAAEKLGDLSPRQAVLEALSVGEARIEEMLGRSSADALCRLARELEVFRSSKI